MCVYKSRVAQASKQKLLCSSNNLENIKRRGREKVTGELGNVVL